MRYIPAFFILCALWMTSCNNAPEQTQETTETEKTSLPPQSKLDEAGTGKLMTVITDYYELKDALVATNANKTDEAATKLMASSDSLQAYIQADSMNRTAIQPYLDSIKTGSNNILAAKDETTETKRIHFELVSNAMYGLLKTVDMKNAGVYRQYCPMAFNDKGAYWLSNETEIRNPYFGKKMLECGEVTDSLK